MKQNIGIYPGTFDPVHKGHVAFALEAARICGLEKIVFLPEHSPRGKQNVTQLFDRLLQLESTLKAHNNLDILVLNTHTLTYKTAMPEIRTALGSDTSLTLLMGSDVARGLANGWDDAELLFKECSVAVGLRGSDTAEEIKACLKQVKNVRCSIVATEYPYESSSDIKTSKL